jgi:hypothetical protein
MSVTPSPGQPPTAVQVRPANESPLLRRTDGQLVIVAVTPAVAQLARVARAIREERKTLRTSGTMLPGSHRGR